MPERCSLAEKVTGKGTQKAMEKVMALTGYLPMSRVPRCILQSRSGESNNDHAVSANPEVQAVLRQNRGRQYR
jgi:hypothetical protein